MRPRGVLQAFLAVQALVMVIGALPVGGVQGRNMGLVAIIDIVALLSLSRRSRSS